MAERVQAEPASVPAALRVVDAPATPAIEARGLAAGYGDLVVFRDLDLAVPRGTVTALCGPNGCGKSTALKAMRRMLPAREGSVLLDGDGIDALKPRALARAVAMLGQEPSAPADMSVRELVGLGRYAHRSTFGSTFGGVAVADREAVSAAIKAVGIADLAERPLGSLSGGQRQRAWIATALAQDAPVMLLDEPTNHLDILHALETLALVRHLARRLGRTVVVVLHDLNLAARHADRIAFFKGGALHAHGPVGEVFTEANIEAVFGIACAVRRLAPGDPPHCVPLGAADRVATDRSIGGETA